MFSNNKLLIDGWIRQIKNSCDPLFCESHFDSKFFFQINVREYRKGNRHWTIQRIWQLCGVHVTRPLVLCVCFVDHCLSFCTFSFSHCVVYP